MSSDTETNVELNNLEDDTILNKYKMSSEIVNKIVKEIVSKCLPGVNLVDLCIAGDLRINEEASKIFKKEKEMIKGIAFPTCISRNNIVANNSPLSGDNADEIIEDGDLVKIDMGAHVDGYAAIVGHTFVVGASKENKITGRKADAILAAYNCAEAALRLIKPTRDSKSVTEPIVNIANEFQCKVLENCATYGMEKDIFENDKTFNINPSDEMKKTAVAVEFAVNQVWTVDVMVSTGDGKVKEKDVRTTVYKRNISSNYQLKMKTSRQFYSEVCNKFIGYPFNIRSFTDLSKAKIGVLECSKHGLVQPLNVMHEKDSEFVAHFKYTVLMTANGPMRLTGLTFENSNYQSQFKVQEAALKTLLSEPIKNKKKVAAPAN